MLTLSQFFKNFMMKKIYDKCSMYTSNTKQAVMLVNEKTSSTLKIKNCNEQSLALEMHTNTRLNDEF